jgi:hypothetical protein
LEAFESKKAKVVGGVQRKEKNKNKIAFCKLEISLLWFKFREQFSSQI